MGWLAQSWQKQYGYDQHLAKANVLRHFRKSDANIAITWEQYRSEQHHRYSNAALRMQSGQKIQPDEQQQLLAHSKAITEALPEEMRVIAVGQNEVIGLRTTTQPTLPGKVVAFPGRDVVAEFTAPPSQEVRDRKSRTSAAKQVDNIPFSSSSFLPTNEEGNTLNPDAYKLWKPKPVEGEILQPSQFRERLAALTRKLSMPKPKPQRGAGGRG